jgi:hypothetical protein
VEYWIFIPTFLAGFPVFLTYIIRDRNNIFMGWLKKALVIDLVLILVVVFVYFYINSLERVNLYCTLNDHACIAKAGLYKSDCTPCLVTMEIGNETDMVTFLLDVTRTWPLGQCTIQETVLNQTGKPTGEYDIEGYVTTCTGDAGGASMNCNGSFYEYLVATLPDDALDTIENVSAGGGFFGSGNGGDDGDGGQDTAIYTICAVGDDACKGDAIEYRKWCTPSVIKVTDTMRGENTTELSYWTKQSTIYRSGNMCILEVEIVGAFNLPPYLPSDIVGKKMTCSYSLSLLPREEIGEDVCVGDLVYYFWSI